MKKNLKLIILLLAMSFLLLGCEEKTESAKLGVMSNGLNSEIVLTHKEDELIKQTTKNIIPYTLYGDEAKSKEMATEEMELFKDLAGVTNKFEFKESEMIQTISIDYSKVDISQISEREIEGLVFEGDISDGISFKATLEMLKNMGYKAIK